MNQKQFLAALKRRGFKVCPNHVGMILIKPGCFVNYSDAPKQTWSSRLAYLIREERISRRIILDPWWCRLDEMYTDPGPSISDEEAEEEAKRLVPITGES